MVIGVISPQLFILTTHSLFTEIRKIGFGFGKWLSPFILATLLIAEVSTAGELTLTFAVYAILTHSLMLSKLSAAVIGSEA